MTPNKNFIKPTGRALPHEAASFLFAARRAARSFPEMLSIVSKNIHKSSIHSFDFMTWIDIIVTVTKSTLS